MTFAFILVPTLCYMGASILYGWKGNWPLAVVYAGYAFANTGLLALDLSAK